MQIWGMTKKVISALIILAFTIAGTSCASKKNYRYKPPKKKKKKDCDCSDWSKADNKTYYLESTNKSFPS